MRRTRPSIRKKLLRVSIVLLLIFGAIAAMLAVMLSMPGKSHRGPFADLSAAEMALRDALRQHVQKLGGDIGERNVFRPARLQAAENWIRAELTSLGYDVTDEEYSVEGTHGFLDEESDEEQTVRKVPCRNLIVEVPGGERAGEVVLLGAHYDSVVGSRGANDNATGVAALLEVARMLQGTSLLRTVRLVAFVNEEPPFFQTEDMGSLVHARASRKRGDEIVAMISFETIGYYRDEKASQQYPPPFNWFYPDVGNFIGFVGNYSSRALVRECVRVFRESTEFPSEGAAPPGQIPGVGWSDHWSFWQEGYPALMVTDTAPFRYPHYHTMQDTPDKVDYDRMARVVAGLMRVVTHLANPEQVIQ